jgi:hypothetical protein
MNYGGAGRQPRSFPDDPFGARCGLSFPNDALSRRSHADFRARATAPRRPRPQNSVAMYSDIDEARAHHAMLRQIIERHAGAAVDFRALRRVLDVCRRATAAIDDRYCRDKLRLVEDFAAELFSHGESRAQFLRQQILDALELFASRLYSIESRRRAAARAGLGAAAPLRP